MTSISARSTSVPVVLGASWDSVGFGGRSELDVDEVGVSSLEDMLSSRLNFDGRGYEGSIHSLRSRVVTGRLSNAQFVDLI